MIELKLHLRRFPDGRIVLELGLGFRIVFGFLATILTLGVFGSGRPTVFSVVALVVLALGALYQEQWTVDPGTRTVSSRHGLMILFRTKTWSFDEIEQITYTHYVAGSMPGSDQELPPGRDDPAAEVMSRRNRLGRGFRRHFLRYSMLLQDGERVRVEIRRVRDWDQDINLPRALAEGIGVSLEETPL